MGGAMRHLTSFLPELSRQDTKREYIIAVRESFPKLNISDNVRLERIPDKQASGFILRINNDILKVPRRLKREKFNAIVSLTNFGPIWTSVPHVFFQRNSLYYCHYYLSKISGRLKMETLMRRGLAYESMKRAKLIIIPSKAMADMIIEQHPQLDSTKFRTLYHGFLKESLSDELDSQYSQQVSEGAGYKFLYPTHPAPHKGFEVLFDILASLKRKGVMFRLFTTISHNDWPEGIKAYNRIIAKLGLEQEVVFMGRVPQEQMGALYIACDLMIYPSLCESFGFSMIEAMGHGLPIVAADTETNREMCSDGAMYYSPLDSGQGARVVLEALQPENMKQLKLNVQKRVDSFDWDWERYTREFIEIVKEAVD